MADDWKRQWRSLIAKWRYEHDVLRPHLIAEYGRDVADRFTVQCDGIKRCGFCQDRALREADECRSG